MGRDTLEASLSTGRIGDLNEIRAVEFLMSEGFEIFRNQSCTGPVDIVSLNVVSGEIKLIDVKTAPVYKGIANLTQNLTDVQKKLGVSFLIYDRVNANFKWGITHDR